MDEVGLASEHLPGLRDRTGHAVNLAVWGDHGPAMVRWDYGSYALPITVRVGATMPMLSSSIGQVYLAHLPATLVDPVLHAERESGSRDEVTQTEIAHIRDTVRRDGVAVTCATVADPVRACSTPPVV